MDSEEFPRWTFSGLIIAFLELALAYCLLCGSAFLLLASKFLLVFNLYVPCPCTGILWYQNGDLCLHKLLFDWPLRKIYTIQNLATDRLPFDIVWRREQEQNCGSTVVGHDGKHENDGLKLGYQMGSSSVSGLIMKNSAEKESDICVKGKKVTHRLHRGKSSPAFLNNNLHSSLAGVSDSSDIARARVVKVEICENPVDDVFQDEFSLQDNSSCCEENALDGETDETREGSSSVKSLIQSDVDTIKMLEQALWKERAARLALASELEKEQASAATAADEAVAMILRLQADKASLQMEAKQYERMIEERFAYDEEELNILKEIIVRQEKDNYFLDKELESYKQIDVSDDELQEDSFDKENNHSGTQTAQIDHSVEKALSFCISEEEKSREDTVKTNINEDCSSDDREPFVFDVHVIEDKTELREEAKSSGNQGSCAEIEWLEERLRNILKVKEELANSAEYKERVSAQMKLMEEILNQLQEISSQTNP